MSIISIDPSKCKRDGICVATCPMGLIEMTDQEAYPTPIAVAEKLCINCGHCVAVCPQGALSLKTMKPKDCVPISKDLFPSSEAAKHLLTARRSIRRYTNQPVERKILAEMIDTARYAPSGHNVRPVDWLVIDDTNEVNRLAAMVIDWMRFCIKEKPEMAKPLHMDLVVAAWEKGEDKVCRSAPHVIVTHAPGAMGVAQSSCTIALTYLELTAFSMGLGACWAGYFSLAANFYPPMTKALNLPEGHQCFGAMMVGYPKYRYHRIPLRNEAVITWR